MAAFLFLGWTACTAPGKGSVRGGSTVKVSKKENGKKRKSKKSKQHTTTSFEASFSLASKPLSRLTAASVELDCGNGDYYLVSQSSEEPSETSNDWQDCSSGTFTTSVDTNAGFNYLYVWFMTDEDEISDAASPLRCWQGNLLELTDPTPEANSGFGSSAYLLDDYYVAVLQRYDATNHSNAGAVYFYNIFGDYIGRIEGVSEDEGLSLTVEELDDGKVWFGSTDYDATGKDNSGRILIVDPSAATVVKEFYGDEDGELFGGFFKSLSNGNYVQYSYNDDYNAHTDNGRLTLLHGDTHTAIIEMGGDYDNDGGGLNVLDLGNGNFVIYNPIADTATKTNVGMIKFVSGTTGATLATYYGDQDNDMIGHPNGVALIGSDRIAFGNMDDDDGVATVDAGSVMLFDLNGNSIATLRGTTATGYFAQYVKDLGNGNFAFAASGDDVGGDDAAGSVFLHRASDGGLIAQISGDDANDALGTITPLANGNFVITAPLDSVDGFTDGGSVRLINGLSGLQMGLVKGDSANDRLGTNLTLLSNGNYVAYSKVADGAVNDTGLVVLVSGTTGNALASFQGDDVSDQLGNTGVYDVGNGNFLILTNTDDHGGDSNVGSIILVNGSDGTELARIRGDNPGDAFGGESPSIFDNGTVWLMHRFDDISGVMNAGSYMFLNGSTGAEIFRTNGVLANDEPGNGVYPIQISDTLALVASYHLDIGGVTDAGKLQLINIDDGSVEYEMSGTQNSEMVGGGYAELLSEDVAIFHGTSMMKNSLQAAGRVFLIPRD